MNRKAPKFYKEKVRKYTKWFSSCKTEIFLLRKRCNKVKYTSEFSKLDNLYISLRKKNIQCFVVNTWYSNSALKTTLVVSFPFAREITSNQSFTETCPRTYCTIKWITLNIVRSTLILYSPLALILKHFVQIIAYCSVEPQLLLYSMGLPG